MQSPMAIGASTRLPKPRVRLVHLGSAEGSADSGVVPPLEGKVSEWTMETIAISTTDAWWAKLSP